MRLMVIVKANEKSEAGEMPSERLLTEMGTFNEELVKGGIMQAGDGLHPSSRGKRVEWAKGGKISVVDGPFTETKELIAGFWIWKVQSMQEAVDWAKRIPNPDGEPGHVELRPLFEIEDFGEEMTPELREQESRLRTNLEGKA